MAFSRSARIKLLLAIDVLFFFIELIVGQYSLLFAEIAPILSPSVHTGYAVGSLALVADSFHMLKCVAPFRS